MERIEGPITDDGAVIEVVVGVSRAREETLTRVGFSVPESVRLRALIDTGSGITGFHPSVFQALDITHIHISQVLTPTTPHDQPGEARVYHDGLRLEAGTQHLILQGIQVIESDDFDPTNPDRLLGLIGRDVLEHCDFEYFGPQKRFCLTLQT